MTTILSIISEEKVYKIDEPRPANAPINQYRIPTYLLEVIKALDEVGIVVNLPEPKTSRIVNLYAIINPSSLLSVGRNAKNEFLGKSGTQVKRAMEILSTLGVASSGSFLMSVVYRMIEEQNIYIGMDVELKDGSLVPMFGYINPLDFSAPITALPLKEFSLWDRISRDPNRYRHTAYDVLSIHNVYMSLSKRILGDNRFADSNGVIFLEKLIEDIKYDSSIDSAEYRDGSKAVREFNISVPAYANAVKSDIKHYVSGTVYLNRASKFGTLTLTLLDSTDNMVMRSSSFKEACAMCCEVTSRQRHQTRIATDMTGTTALESKRGGVRFITVTFPIDGWG